MPDEKKISPEEDVEHSANKKETNGKSGKGRKRFITRNHASDVTEEGATRPPAEGSRDADTSSDATDASLNQKPPDPEQTMSQRSRAKKSLTLDSTASLKDLSKYDDKSNQETKLEALDIAKQPEQRSRRHGDSSGSDTMRSSQISSASLLPSSTQGIVHFQPRIKKSRPRSMFEHQPSDHSSANEGLNVASSYDNMDPMPRKKGSDKSQSAGSRQSRKKSSPQYSKTRAFWSKDQEQSPSKLARSKTLGDEAGATEISPSESSAQKKSDQLPMVSSTISHHDAESSQRGSPDGSADPAVPCTSDAKHKSGRRAKPLEGRSKTTELPTVDNNKKGVDSLIAVHKLPGEELPHTWKPPSVKAAETATELSSQVSNKDLKGKSVSMLDKQQPAKPKLPSADKMLNLDIPSLSKPSSFNQKGKLPTDTKVYPNVILKPVNTHRRLSDPYKTEQEKLSSSFSTSDISQDFKQNQLGQTSRSPKEVGPSEPSMFYSQKLGSNIEGVKENLINQLPSSAKPKQKKSAKEKQSLESVVSEMFAPVFSSSSFVLPSSVPSCFSTTVPSCVLSTFSSSSASSLQSFPSYRGDSKEERHTFRHHKQPPPLSSFPVTSCAAQASYQPSILAPSSKPAQFKAVTKQYNPITTSSVYPGLPKNYFAPIRSTEAGSVDPSKIARDTKKPIPATCITTSIASQSLLKPAGISPTAFKPSSPQRSPILIPSTSPLMSPPPSPRRPLVVTPTVIAKESEGIARSDFLPVTKMSTLTLSQTSNNSSSASLELAELDSALNMLNSATTVPQSSTLLLRDRGGIDTSSSWPDEALTAVTTSTHLSSLASSFPSTNVTSSQQRFFPSDSSTPSALHDKIKMIKEKYQEQMSTHPDANVQEKMKLLKDRYKGKFINENLKSLSMEKSPRDSSASASAQDSESTDDPNQGLRSARVLPQRPGDEKHDKTEQSYVKGGTSRKEPADWYTGAKESLTSQNIDKLMKRKLIEIAQATAPCPVTEGPNVAESPSLPRRRTSHGDGQPQSTRNVPERSEINIPIKTHSESAAKTKPLSKSKEVEASKANVGGLNRLQDLQSSLELFQARRDLDIAEKVNHDLMEYFEQEEQFIGEEAVESKSTPNGVFTNRIVILNDVQPSSETPVSTSPPHSREIIPANRAQMVIRASSLPNMDEVEECTPFQPVQLTPTILTKVRPKESAEERRQRLMKEDSFNLPDSPEPNPMPLPDASVIKRYRQKCSDSSSSSGTESPIRSPRLSPRAKRRKKKPKQTGPFSKFLDVPKTDAAM